MVDVPAFTQCGSGTEDLSPLLTGMVSGPGNQVDVTQVSELTPYGCISGAVKYPQCTTVHPPTTYGS